jgi:hypothetical protein
MDVVFDGADEADEWLNCAKGRGACFLQKIVAVNAGVPGRSRCVWPCLKRDEAQGINESRSGKTIAVAVDLLPPRDSRGGNYRLGPIWERYR